MIVTEYYSTRKDGIKLYKTYSDNNKMIHKLNTEEVYDIAIDVENSGFIYEETDEDIPVYPEDQEEQLDNE